MLPYHQNKSAFVLFLLISCSFLLGAGPAQAAGRLDGSFNPLLETTGGSVTVNEVVLQADGKIIIGGSFTSVNGIPRNNIARLNADGTVDTSFNPGTGANDLVSALALQGDGKIIVGGAFTAIDGMTLNRIARLNADGTVDTSFNPGMGPSSPPAAVAIQADQKIVIGGSFSTVNGATQRLIARLNADGTPDSSINLSFFGDAFGVSAIAVQTDGKIIFGGDFDNINGVAHRNIARLNADGTLDISFNASATGATGDGVRAMALQADGKLVLGGGFIFVNGALHRRIARLNADGTLDTSFNPIVGNTDTLLDHRVFSVAVQADQKIVIGGAFFSVNGEPRSRVARLNADGSLDTSFGTLNDSFYTSHAGPNISVDALAVQADGKILIGGSFTTVNGISRTGLARLIGRGHSNADFDRDVRADISVWNPSTQNWHILNSNDNSTRVQLGWGSGALGDVPVPGDYDGDARADIAVWRPSEGNWYIIQSMNGSPLIRHWGQQGDVPIAGDYDGDGTTDVAVFRPAEGNWYIIKSSGGVLLRNWGVSSDTPVPADYDGDGRTDIAVFRPSENNWHILNSATNAATVQHWGTNTDKLVPADYDADGRVDVAVFRPAEGTWYIRLWTGAVTIRGWGNATDIPVPADYNGDGRADIAIFRPAEANWYIIESGILNTTRLINFGQNGVVPVPAAYLPQ